MNNYFTTADVASATTTNQLAPQEEALLQRIYDGLGMRGKDYGMIARNPYQNDQVYIYARKSKMEIVELSLELTTSQGSKAYTLETFDVRLVFFTGGNQQDAAYVLTDQNENILASSLRKDCAVQSLVLAPIGGTDVDELPRFMGLKMHYDLQLMPLPMQAIAITSDQNSIQLWTFEMLQKRKAVKQDLQPRLSL